MTLPAWFLAVSFTHLTLACGWVALWPLRRRLGAVGYHLAAFPVGLLGWVAVAFVGSLGEGAWSLADVITGLAATVGAFAFGGALVARGAIGVAGRVDGEANGDAAPRFAGYLLWALALAVVAALVQTLQITAGSYDGVFHYASWGVWFHDGGGLGRFITGAYGPLLPAVHAAGRAFGIDWMSTPWPVLAVHVALLVGWAVRDAARRVMRRDRAFVLAAAVSVLLATTAPFVGHTLYVHSHMTSAAYLLLAFVGIWRGLVPGAAGDDPVEPVWLWVAGLGVAGLALARVDGLAYAAVPLVLGAVLRLERGASSRVLFAPIAATVIPVAAYYAWAFAALGGWESEKLSGRSAAAVLVALLALAIVALWIDRVPVLGRLVARRPRLWVAAGLAASLGTVAVLKWESFSLALAMMWRNLTRSGGFGTLWYVLAAMIVLSLVSRALWARGRWPGALLLGIGLFAAVAVIVHGVGHPGRVGPADSFSRVSFHVVPLAFWYAGTFAAGLFGRPEPRAGLAVGMEDEGIAAR